MTNNAKPTFYNKGSIQIVSCPTCGRTKIDLIDLSKQFKNAIKSINTNGKDIKIALMVKRYQKYKYVFSCKVYSLNY